MTDSRTPLTDAAIERADGRQGECSDLAKRLERSHAELLWILRKACNSIAITEIPMEWLAAIERAEKVGKP